jgi:hypothetical protein
VLENFLSEGFAEHLQGLVAVSPPLSFADLPDKLRLSSVFESLKFAMAGPRYGAPTDRAGRYADVIAAARRIVDERVDPRSLSYTAGNPSSERVGTMFKTLGVGEVLIQVRPQFDARWGKPESSTFITDKLDEIVNARHRVAHAADALASRGHI